MVSLADQIELYLKKLLAKSQTGVIEISRQDLSKVFMCVPSQINYVLGTRFNKGLGYHVESRRGGGGFIRIIQLNKDDFEDILLLIEESKDKKLSQDAANRLLNRLQEEGFITTSETLLLKSVMDPRTLALNVEDNDLLRNRMIRSILLSLLREDFIYHKDNANNDKQSKQNTDTENNN